MIRWARILEKKKMISGDVTEIYKTVSSMTAMDRDQLPTVPSRNIRSHQLKFGMLVPHTLGPRPVEVLAKHIVMEEVYVRSGQDVLGRMIHKMSLNKQTVKDLGNLRLKL